MAFVGYEQVAISNAVKTVSDLTIPAKAQWAVIQADDNHIRYTLDGTAPTTTSGMKLLTTSDGTNVDVSDLLKIKFIRDASTDAVLLIHYSAGRDV